MNDTTKNQLNEQPEPVLESGPAVNPSQQAQGTAHQDQRSAPGASSPGRQGEQPDRDRQGSGTLESQLSQDAMKKLHEGASNGEDRPNLDVVMLIPVSVQVVLGTAKMPIVDLMKLGPNSVIPLNRHVGDPIDVVVNGRLVARGEVVLMEDDSSRFGISLTEIVGPGSDKC